MKSYLIDELKAYRHWACWVRQPVPGKPGRMTKIPRIADFPLGGGAKVNDPATWRDYGTAREAARAAGADGVSFALTLDLPYICIDLDHCLNQATGELTEKAAEVVAIVGAAGGTYMEISPSGGGLHIWGTASLPAPKEKGLRNEWLEIYRASRFMTVTGNAYAATPVGNIQGAINEILSRYDLMKEERCRDAAAAKSLYEKYRGRAAMNDDELIEKIRHSSGGAKFSRLFDDGDLSPYGGDHSSADMALLSILAWWTKGNPYQMGRLFLKSALAATLSRKVHHEEDYLQRSISRAVAFHVSRYGADGGYTPPGAAIVEPGRVSSSW